MDMGLQELLASGPGQPSSVVPSLSLPHHRINTRGDTNFSRAGSPVFSSFNGSYVHQSENASAYGGDDSDSPASGIYPGPMASNLASRLYQSVSRFMPPSEKISSDMLVRGGRLSSPSLDRLGLPQICADRLSDWWRR
jgi:hypothetical protein